MDIETFNDEKGKINAYCICFIINNEFYYFWYEKDIWKKFFEKISELSNHKEIEIYTHNINFDGYVIIDYLKETNIFFDWFIRDLNLYWIKISYLKTIIKIRCSYKIIPISVSKLGEMIGFKKLIFPYKFVNLETLSYIGKIPKEEYFNSKKEYILFKEDIKIFNLKEIAINYCKRDIEIVQKVLIEIIKIINLYDKKIINKSFSFSSISYKIYLKKFDKYEIKDNRPNLTEYNYYKNAYYGGRCEVFGNPEEGDIIHYFDFTGMYSQCMLEKFPIGKPIFKEKNLDYNKIGFHTIKFKVSAYLPFLPFRLNKLMFPNGIMIGTYWYEEIKNAIEYKKCEVLDHYSSYEYDKEEYIFKNYVEEFINLRKKGIYYNYFGKNMINGLYGSFALNEEDYLTIIIYNEIEFNSVLELTDVIKWKKIGKVYIIDVIKNEKSSIYFDKRRQWKDPITRNVAYASIISSKARIKLNIALENVINNNGKLFYTDTDSIFAGFKENRINKKLGEIKWSNTYSDAVFISSKFYYLKEENLKLKGINVKNYDFNKIKKDFYENKLYIKFDSQLNIKKKDYSIFLEYISKEIDLKAYDKRIFTKDKKKTIPISIE